MCGVSKHCAAHSRPRSKVCRSRCGYLGVRLTMSQLGLAPFLVKSHARSNWRFLPARTVSVMACGFRNQPTYVVRVLAPSSAPDGSRVAVPSELHVTGT